MILITGATGNLGSNLLLQLAPKENNIIALYLNTNPENVKKLFTQHFENYNEIFAKIIWKKVDITDFLQLEELFEEYQITHIYHCAAFVSIPNREKEKYFSINTNATESLVNLSLKFNVQKFCYISSIAALSNTNNEIISENDILNPTLTNSYYSLSKYYGEMHVWRGIEEGLDAFILSPSIILAQYKIDNRILKYFFNQGIRFSVPGGNGFVDVMDMTKIMEMIMNSDIKNEKFIVSAENFMFKDAIDIINKSINKEIKTKPISKILLKIIISIPFIKKINAIFDKNMLHYLYNCDKYNNEKLIKSLNFTFKPISQSLSELSNYYQKNLSKNLH